MVFNEKAEAARQSVFPPKEEKTGKPTDASASVHGEED